MNPIRRMNIASRIAVGFGTLLVAAAILTVISLAGLRHASTAVAQIVDVDWTKATAAATVDTMTRANARRTMELFFTRDAAHAATVRERIAANRQAIDAALKTLDELVARPEAKTLLGQIKESRAAYVASLGQIDKLIAEGQRDAAERVLLEQTLPALDALQGRVDALAKLQARLAVEAGEEVSADVRRTTTWLLALGLAMLAAAVGMGWWLARAIAGPIEQAVQVAERVASGDLGHRVRSDEGGEPGRLVRALDQMDGSLVKVVGRVREASESIATGSTQIATGTTDLSQRTEEQAANLQQTAASMEQLAGTVRNSAEAARDASALAMDASTAAAQGGELMEAVSQTMQRISVASRRIGEINAVIDGIAFQTNILALNAAVEAARAGEHGRGFAVVASEVRALARRSADAAKDIKDLVVNSVGSVEEGNARVDEAARQIGSIVGQVRRVSETVAHISHAAEEQTRGIDQVNQAIAQLDQVTQQNAALVEESAAASDSLRHQAQQLVAAVGAFRIDAVRV